MATLGTLTVYLNANVAKFNKKMASANRQFFKLQRTAKIAGAAAGAAVATFAAKAVKDFATFEEKMRNVNSIAKQSEAQFQQTSTAVQTAAARLGMSSIDLADALYDINSASFQGGEGLKVLEASAVAAKAGLTTTKTAAKAVTAVLNAYGMSAEQATDVSDILFKTVEKGVVTFEELSTNLGASIASASAAGVKFEEVGAALATITRGGIDAAEASTALNKLLLAFVKPTTELNKLFKGLGFESATAAIQAKGLAGVMKDIQNATGGAAGKIAALGFGVRDIKAALALTRNEGRDFAGDLKAMGDRAGATQAAFDEQSKSLAFQWKRGVANLQNLSVVMGEIISKSFRLGEGFKSANDTFAEFVTDITRRKNEIIIVIQSMAIEIKYAFKQSFAFIINSFNAIKEELAILGKAAFEATWAPLQIISNFITRFPQMMDIVATRFTSQMETMKNAAIEILAGTFDGDKFARLMASEMQASMSLLQKLAPERDLDALSAPVKTNPFAKILDGIDELETEKIAALQALERSAMQQVNKMKSISDSGNKAADAMSKGAGIDLKRKPEATKFSAAMEKGTVEAYRAELTRGNDSLEQTSKQTANNTKDTAAASKEIARNTKPLQMVAVG